MSVAAIYDIHGNLPALEAVLDEIRTEGVEEVLVGGDVVPGPMPRECLSALLALPVPVRFLRGNGESDVLAAHRKQELDRVPAVFRETLRWTADQLSAEHLSELGAWPLVLHSTIPDTGDALFCHATPRNDNEVFTRLTPEERLRPLFATVDADVLICGHTHMQFDRKVGEMRVVNAGSVGMPFGDAGADWALIGPGVELRHTSYDLDAAQERIAATEYPLVSDFDVRRPPSKAVMLEVFEGAAPE